MTGFLVRFLKHCAIVFGLNNTLKCSIQTKSWRRLHSDNPFEYALQHLEYTVFFPQPWEVAKKPSVEAFETNSTNILSMLADAFSLPILVSLLQKTSEGSADSTLQYHRQRTTRKRRRWWDKVMAIRTYNHSTSLLSVLGNR